MRFHYSDYRDYDLKCLESSVHTAAVMGGCESSIITS